MLGIVRNSFPLLLLSDQWETSAGFQGPHAQPRTAGPQFLAEMFPLADSSAQKHSKCAEGAAGTLNQTPPFAAPWNRVWAGEMSERGKATGFWAPASDHDLPWESTTVSPPPYGKMPPTLGGRHSWTPTINHIPPGRACMGCGIPGGVTFFSKPPAITATVAQLPFQITFFLLPNMLICCRQTGKMNRKADTLSLPLKELI